MTETTEVVKYEELQKEVTFYEKKVKQVGWSTIRLILVIALIFTIGGFFFEAIVEKWDSLLFHLLFWSLIYYIVRIQKNYHRLINKKRELHNMLLQNPTLAKMAA